MDPVTALGAAGSVVGIAGFGIQLSQILTKYASRFLSAQESLQKIVDEIDSTSHALKEVYLLIREELDSFDKGKPLLLFTETSLLNVKQTADQCLVIFWRIEATIEATISGDSSANTKEKLIKKLNEFNKLNSYSSNFPIAIELRPISNPLDSRQKARWTTNVSKLEDYCEQLRRLKINLTLTFQVVSLGHQRSQSKPTVEDFHLMVKTYAIISQIATQDELRAIANQAQKQGQTLHGKAERTDKLSKPVVH
ncbi:hypothetical protein F5Y18DRAFT_356077 [Xylariaceae sp. FL1019]|nr:hypothetical protein F5Y18DRAFT_356077 [Xylariaceae sp. FL1019]